MSFKIRCLVAGDFGVGKSSVVWTYNFGTFPGDSVPEICDVYQNPVTFDDMPYTLEIVDSWTKQEVERLRPLQYSAVDVIILCYSAVNRDSFNNVKAKWLPEIRQYCHRATIILVATKIDLRTGEDGRSEVTAEEGHQRAKEIGVKAFVEISAKENASEAKNIFQVAVNEYLIERKKRLQHGHSHAHPCRLV